LGIEQRNIWGKIESDDMTERSLGFVQRLRHRRETDRGGGTLWVEVNEDGMGEYIKNGLKATGHFITRNRMKTSIHF